MARMTVAEWMAAAGFMDGHRVSGDIVEIIDSAASHRTPTAWSECVRLTTIDTTMDSDHAVTPDVDGVPLWALRDAIDGCNCYALAGLRWANRSQGDVHDVDCKCNQG